MESAWPMGYGLNDPAAIPPPGMMHLQRAGVLVTPHTLLQVDVVFTALRLITTAILEMGDPRAYSEASSKDNIVYKKYIASQPSVLTDTWGGRMMQYDGRRRTVMSMALFGEAFWYTLDRDVKPKRFGLPTSLEVLHPAFMEVKTHKVSGGPEYIYGTGVNKRTLDPEDVTHIPFMAMPQARRALNTAEYAGISGALAMAAYEFGATWFSQGASPSFLLATDQKLGQAEVERIAQKFIIEHSGLSNSHRPLVIDQGLTATKMMSSPDEAQYLNTLEYARNVIGSWFGVDELIPNALQRQTPPPAHSAQERMQRFLTFTTSGYTTPMAEAFGGMLLPAQKVDWNEGALLQPDSQFLAQLIMALRQAQVGSVNDLRTRYLGWAPVPGGDDPLAPLASNTDQSAMNGGPDTPPDDEPPPAPTPAPKAKK